MPTNILVLGAGELGTQVLTSLAQHPARKTSSLSISALIRPTSLTPTDPAKARHLQTLKSLNITPIPGDVANDPAEDLAATFAPFDTVISCTGFVAGKGTQLKITRAVLAAAVRWYVPWQFGFDYEVIGRGSGQEVFDEQLDVRDLLSAQDGTAWVVLSTGVFTGFLFERVFGVMDVPAGVVCALGGWENRVTVTAVEDVGAVTAEMVLGVDAGEGFGDRVVYVAGDTLSYAELAEVVERVTGKVFERRCLTVQEVRNELVREPQNALRKYQLVFGMGRGVAWDLEETWNARRGIRLLTAEEWARRNLVTG